MVISRRQKLSQSIQSRRISFFPLLRAALECSHPAHRGALSRGVVGAERDAAPAVVSRKDDTGSPGAPSAGTRTGCQELARRRPETVSGEARPRVEDAAMERRKARGQPYWPLRVPQGTRTRCSADRRSIPLIHSRGSTDETSGANAPRERSLSSRAQRSTSAANDAPQTREHERRCSWIPALTAGAARPG
jgi:hypothetical protein